VRAVVVPGILAISVAILGACTGASQGSKDSARVSPPAPAASPVPTPSAVPGSPGGLTPTAVATPRSCAAASSRDESRRFSLSLAEPVCLVIAPQAAPGATIVTAISGRAESVHQLGANETTFFVPDDLSLYGRNGCAANPDATMRLTVRNSRSEVEFEALYACSANTMPDECRSLDFVGGSVFATSASGVTCVSWKPSLNLAYSFRVETTYPRIARVFAYQAPPGATYLRLPSDAAPGLRESLERCLQRHYFDLAVYALRSSGEDLVESNAVVAECNR